MFLRPIRVANRQTRSCNCSLRLLCMPLSRYSTDVSTTVTDPLLTLFQRAEDNRRLEFGLAPLMRFPKSSRIPLKDINISDTEDVTAFRAQLGTIVGLLDQLSVDIESRPNTGIEARVMRPLKYGNGRIYIPKFPDQWTKENLLKYLRTITRRQYVDWKLDSSVGVVQALIKDLLRINNASTLKSVSLEAYKVGIEHFIRHKQIRSARLLFNDMPAVNIKPDLDIYNSLLLANEITSRNEKAKVIVHPLLVTDKLLRSMLEANVYANYETWNAVLTSIKGSLGKSLVLEEMKKRGVPLTERAHAIIIRELIRLRDTKYVMEYLDNLQNGTVGIGILGIVLQQLLQERQYTVAWDYLLYASNKWKIEPTTPLLNHFAKYLASSTQRVDWILGIWAAMEQRWEVKADTMTWSYLFEAAQSCPLHKNKNAVLEMIYAHMATETGLSPHARILVNVALRKAEFYKENYGQALPEFVSSVTEEQRLALSNYKECFRWSFSDEISRYKKEGMPIDNIHYGQRDSERSVKASELGIPRYQHNMQKPTTHTKIRNKRLNVARTGSLKQLFSARQKVVKEYADEIAEMGPYKKLQKDLVSLGVIDK